MSCAIPPLAAGVIALAAMAAHAAEPLAGGDEAGVTAAAVAGKSRAMTAMALAGQPRVADAEGAMAGGAAPIEVESREAASSARWTSSAELVGRSYRWSLSRGALDLGLRFDTPRSATPAANLGTPPSPAGAELPAISLGWRVPVADHAPSAGTLLERAMASAKGESYGSRFGVEWKPAEPEINFLRDGLGIRLEGANRMTVRLRKGMLGIYMHRTF